jgi:hypothetical protein
LTKLALFAATAEADGIAIKLNQAVAIIEARFEFLIRVPSRTINCFVINLAEV